MKKGIIKKITSLLLFFLVVSYSNTMAGIPVTCVNCSTMFTQIMEYILQIEELMEGIKRYEELAAQTENMIKNTKNLPSDLKGNLMSQLDSAVSNVKKLETYKGDMDALHTIFTDTWPELKNMKDSDGTLMSDRILKRSSQLKSAVKKMDNILRSNFQLSGKQLQEMQDSGDFEDYIADLLLSKSGRQQAIEAGNQINSIAVNELRQNRALLANFVQAQTTALAQEQQEKKVLEAQEQRDLENGINRTGVTLPDL